MSDTITLQKDDLLKAHADGCADVKKTLERLYPRVFEEKDRWPDLPPGGVAFFLHQNGSPAVAIANHNTSISAALMKRYPGDWCNGFYENKKPSVTAKGYYTPIHNGRILIVIEDMKIVSAELIKD